MYDEDEKKQTKKMGEESWIRRENMACQASVSEENQV